MLGNKKLKKILDTLDGVGTGHGASLDELKSLAREIEYRIGSTEALTRQTDALLARWRL